MAFNLTPPGSWTTVYGVVAIGVLILLVACFNFMNLATARAMLRAREIALRKTMGASRRQLIVQFLGEAVLMALMALVLALALVEILLPAFGGFLQRPIVSIICATGRCCSLIWRRGGGRPDQRQSIRRWCCRASAPPLPCAPTVRARPDRAVCAPRWWCCSSPSPSAWASRPSVVFSQINLCPQHRTGLPPRQHRDHRQRPHDAAAARKLRRSSCAPIRASLAVGLSNMVAVRPGPEPVPVMQAAGPAENHHARQHRHQSGLSRASMALSWWPGGSVGSPRR